MMRNLASALACMAVLCGASPAAAGTCAPAKVIHIVTTDVTPGILAGSFGAQPRGFYRVDGGPDAVEILELRGTARPAFVAPPGIPYTEERP